MRLLRWLLVLPALARSGMPVSVPWREIAPGVDMPMLSIGTGGRATAQHTIVESTVAEWLKLGGRGIDTAWLYMDQVDVAKGIATSAVKRDELFITTKLLVCGGRQLTRWFVEYDLGRLNTSYIDLLILHYPVGFDCKDTWAALEDYLLDGVVRAIGVSNFQQSHLENLLRTAKVKPAVNQIQVNLWHHGDDTLAFCKKHNITVMAYSPLGWTGTPSSVSNTNRTLTNPSVLAIAKTHEVTPAQVVLRWVVQQGYPLVFESHSGEHILQDVDIFKFKLTKAEMATLSSLQASPAILEAEPIVTELIGVLGQSGGDVQSCSEVESYSKNLFKDGLLPSSIPASIRSAMAELAWLATRKQTMEEYEAVPNQDCNTRLRDVSVLMTQAAAARARELTGRPIQAFSGWKFDYGKGTQNSTTVIDALSHMQASGVTQAYVFDQDFLAYDDSWIGLTYRQIREYLSQHPEWKVRFTGINSFTTQPGWIELLASKLEQQVAAMFPGVTPEDLCVVLPSQGVPQSAEASKGSGVPLIRAAFAKLQARLPSYNLTLVFTNHGGGPVPWSAPDDKEKIPQMAKGYACANVLATPILQWPQTDYTVYVFQGNGTKDEPGYAKTFGAAGKSYRHAPAWDLAMDVWQGRPPAPGAVPPSAIDVDLPNFIALLLKDVLMGKTVGYDLTTILPTEGLTASMYV